MRLRQVSGFVVGQLPSAPTRLVVYCAAQEAPVLVSESAVPEEDGILNVKSRTGQLTLESGRSIRVALRVFQQEGSEWKLIKETSLDLRHLLPCSKMTEDEEWAALSEDQRMFVPTSFIRLKEPAQMSKISPSYSTLNELWTLQKVLDDVRNSAEALEAEVDQLIPGSPIVLNQQVIEIQRRIAKTKKFTQRTKMLTERAKKRTRDLNSSKSQTSHNLEQSCEAMHAASSTDSRQKELKLENFEPQIRSEQSRLARQLLEIFPIEPAGGSFHFSICGLVLPSIFAINHYDPVQVAAALSLVAQLVVALSVYLDVALPYPVFPYGSQSYIVDDISQMKGSRVFPLWTKGALLYRVEYALYLLHKDIEQLVNSRDLAVADLKQTLANLKNLLLVLSAGG